MSLRIIRKCKHCCYNFSPTDKECPNCHDRHWWTEIALTTSNGLIKSLPISVFICVGIIIFAIGALYIISDRYIIKVLNPPKSEIPSVRTYNSTK